MRQIVSLIRDDQVQYALVDEEDGSLVPFASITLPDPDRFGLHEAAVLGTNLINTLGLGVNGTRPRPKAVAAKQEAVVERSEKALPPAPADETYRERANRKAREKYAAYKAGAGDEVKTYRPQKMKRGRSTPEEYAAAGRRYITEEEVIAVVNRHPEGVRGGAIAAEIWEGPPPNWAVKAVANRIDRMMFSERLPFRVEKRQRILRSGVPGHIVDRWLYPLSTETVATPL